MAHLKIDDSTKQAAVEAAQHPTQQGAIDLLAAAASSSFGPLAGLAIKFGAPLALDAIAKRRGHQSAETLTDAEIRLTASELLESKTFEEIVAEAEEAAARQAPES